MKTEFELDAHKADYTGSKIKIIGKAPKHKPYVTIALTNRDTLFIEDKDLERFAINILKALKSKKLQNK